MPPTLAKPPRNKTASTDIEKWIDALKNPEAHTVNGKKDSDYIQAVESLSYILLGINEILH